MARYDSKRKTKRDVAIRKFIREHPSWSWTEVGEKFGLSKGRISQIWRANLPKEENHES